MIPRWIKLPAGEFRIFDTDIIMKPWRRTSSSRTPATAVAHATVLQVAQDDPTHADWQFSEAIGVIIDASQFIIDGNPGLAADPPIGDTVTITYAAAPLGSIWSASDDSAITFPSGHSLAVPESGLVT